MKIYKGLTFDEMLEVLETCGSNCAAKKGEDGLYTVEVEIDKI